PRAPGLAPPLARTARTTGMRRRPTGRSSLRATRSRDGRSTSSQRWAWPWSSLRLRFETELRVDRPTVGRAGGDEARFVIWRCRAGHAHVHSRDSHSSALQLRRVAQAEAREHDAVRRAARHGDAVVVRRVAERRVVAALDADDLHR